MEIAALFPEKLSFAINSLTNMNYSYPILTLDVSFKKHIQDVIGNDY